MPRKIDFTDNDALDVLRNEIADYVLDEYCKTKKCPYLKGCEECIFNKAIYRTITLINRKNKRITELGRVIKGE